MKSFLLRGVASGTAVVALFFLSASTEPELGRAATSQLGSAPGILCGTSAAVRTRPFLVGEKIAYFTNIQDGDKVQSPFRVAFAVSGMGVSPVKAGMLEGTGHHHILIDLPLPADIKAPIPFDPPGQTAHQHYKHFGGGETETVLNLPPGVHTLRLLFADSRHIPYYISSQVITIEVLAGEYKG
jgi:hypothetical protein